ncbi:DNA circularization N-terminal domain-containing protein, partial [Pseudomonas sp.]|uniref:DNA circularization N-terminal domain-containing protein n=1 Tax=Pseudomonas sp. TaxID=306 RepID=UPI0026221019
MAWRDDYRPGAFRGVPFHLKSSSSSGGRRTVLNEFPLRDEPMTEDLGRRARKFQLSMTVIGPDYMAQRDRLIAALETAGPGTLMHPFRGELLVAVYGDYSCEESTEQGGLARISATFVEAGATPRPDSQLAQGSVGNAAADALQTDAMAEFEEEFSVAGFASFVAEGTIDSLQAATQSVLNAGGLLQGAGEFGSLFRGLTNNFQQLILAPGNLGGQLLGLVRGLNGGFSNPLQALKAQMALFGLGDKAKPVTGATGYQPPARAQLAANQVATY